ncbi:MAG: hypothetical protein GY759_06355, partial [Chloroflexi bacterium]|nr:hypothetical protein [Chloroflexota bacterium]
QSLGVSDVPPAAELPEDTEIWAVTSPVHGENLAIRSRATDLAGNVEPLKSPVRASQAQKRILLPLIFQ